MPEHLDIDPCPPPTTNTVDTSTDGEAQWVAPGDDEDGDER